MAIAVKFGYRQSEVISAVCTSTEQVGDFVYLRNIINGQKRVRRAEPRDQDKMPAYGVIVSKQSDTSCRIRVYGETPGIFSNLDVGELYFLDLEGKVTRQPPEALGGGYSFVQPLGIAADDTKMHVIIGTELTKRRSE